MDILILHLLRTREKYEKYSQFVNSEFLAQEAAVIFEDMGIWFTSEHSYLAVDWDAFSVWFKFTRHPTFSTDKHKLYQKLFQKLIETTDEDIINPDALIHGLLLRYHATKMQAVCNQLVEGQLNSTDKLEEALTVCKAELVGLEQAEELAVSTDLSALTAEVMGAGGYSWRLPCLNKAIGPLRKGDFVVVGAVAEVGKTTFALSEATFMAEQAAQEGKIVLYFNNESAGISVMSRAYTSALGVGFKKLMKHPDKYKEKYSELYGGLDTLLVIDDNRVPSTVKAITKVLDRYAGKIGLIVFDQLWKIHCNNKGSTVENLAFLFRQCREWAKRYAPTIALHQARDYEHGDGGGGCAPWIPMSRLYGSPTAIKGEADVIIMVSSDEKGGGGDARYLNITKNKLVGDEDTEEALRHAKFCVKIDSERGRYYE